MRTSIHGRMAATGAALLTGLTLTGLALTGLPLRAAPALAAPESPPPETRLVGVVNINTATVEQLELLPLIGPARARAIVEYRKSNGGFKTVDDLERVSGIGQSALARIRPHCVTQGKSTAKLSP